MSKKKCTHCFVDTGVEKGGLETKKQLFKCKYCDKEKWYPSNPHLWKGKQKEYFSKQNHAIFKSRKKYY